MKIKNEIANHASMFINTVLCLKTVEACCSKKGEEAMTNGFFTGSEEAIQFGASASQADLHQRNNHVLEKIQQCIFNLVIQIQLVKESMSAHQNDAKHQYFKESKL